MRVYTDAGLWEVMSNWDEVQHIDTKPYFLSDKHQYLRPKTKKRVQISSCIKLWLNTLRGLY